MCAYDEYTPKTCVIVHHAQFGRGEAGLLSLRWWLTKELLR